MTRVPWGQPALAAFLASTATLVVAWLWTPSDSPLQGIVVAATGGHALLLAVRAVRALPAAERRPWWWLSVGIVAVCGHVLFTTFVDVGALESRTGLLLAPAAGACLACCWSLGRLAESRSRKRISVGPLDMEGVYVCFAVFTLAYAVVAEPVLTSGSLAAGQTAVLLGYCGFVAVTIGWSAVITTTVPARLRASATWVFVIQVLCAVATVSYALTGRSAGFDAEVLLTVNNVALVLTAYCVVMAVRLAADTPGRVVVERQDGSRDPLALRVVRVTLLVPFAVLGTTLVRGEPISTPLTVLCCALLLIVAIGTAVYVGEVSRLTQTLVGTEERFRSMVESSSDLLTVLDDELRIVFASPAAGSILGREPEELAGTCLLDIVDGDRDHLVALFTRGGGGEHVHVRLGDGESREIEVVAEGRRETGLIVRLRDVTVRRQHERALEQMAYTDQLTGLPNRAAFTAAGRRWTTEHGNDGLSSLLVLDLDGFKAVNDTAGHEAGDQLLVEVGRRLRRVVRTEDVVARLGGDEFALLVRGTPTEADDVARRLLASVSMPHATSVGTFAVGASIGITTIGRRGAQAAFREADTALRSAKELGKGCVRRYTSSTLRDSARSATLGQDLGEALTAGRLQVRYRPITAPRTGRILAVQAHPCWPHPRHGEVEEVELRALAAGQGLCDQLQRWVVEQVSVDIGPLVRAGADVQVAITVPAGQRVDDTTVERFLGLLARAGIAPERVVLLVSEETLLTSSPGLLDGLRQVHTAGMRLCIADYGLGHTLTVHRALLPFDMARVDLQLLGQDEVEVELGVRAAAAIVVPYGMQLVLDGVSTGLDHSLACELDVAGFAGHFVHAPAPVGALPRLLGVTAGAPAALDRPVSDHPDGDVVPELAGSAS